MANDPGDNGQRPYGIGEEHTIIENEATEGKSSLVTEHYLVERDGSIVTKTINTYRVCHACGKVLKTIGMHSGVCKGVEGEENEEHGVMCFDCFENLRCIACNHGVCIAHSGHHDSESITCQECFTIQQSEFRQMLLMVVFGLVIAGIGLWFFM